MVFQDKKIDYMTLHSRKYIDGKEFIQWMDDKNNLMKTYIQRCWRFHGVFHGQKIW